jgi:hypothetical protein
MASPGGTAIPRRHYGSHYRVSGAKPLQCKRMSQSVGSMLARHVAGSPARRERVALLRAIECEGNCGATYERIAVVLQCPPTLNICRHACC